jgi:hypothetical protein
MTEVDEVASIINESGNSFHSRATNYFREKGWHTLLSPYYMDSATNKPREIDLIAEKSWPYNDAFEGKFGTVNIKLFIECKYIPQTNVFWFGEKDMASTQEWVLSNTPLRERNTFTEQHHYISTNRKVAKLFASKNRPNVENEVMYKALNQSLNAMVYLRHRSSIIPRVPNRNYNILATVEIPVILCNSFEKFHRVEIEDSNAAKTIEENFQLEVNYAYIDRNQNHRDEYFLIDVVDFNKIDDFLALIQADIDAIFQII